MECEIAKKKSTGMCDVLMQLTFSNTHCSRNTFLIFSKYKQFLSSQVLEQYHPNCRPEPSLIGTSIFYTKNRVT